MFNSNESHGCKGMAFITDIPFVLHPKESNPYMY